MNFEQFQKNTWVFSCFVIIFKPDLAVIKSVCLNYNETMADQKFETQSSDLKWNQNRNHSKYTNQTCVKSTCKLYFVALFFLARPHTQNRIRLHPAIMALVFFSKLRLILCTFFHVMTSNQRTVPFSIFFKFFFYFSNSTSFFLCMIYKHKQTKIHSRVY